MEHTQPLARIFIGVKVSPEEREKLHAAARREDRALANWARKALLAAAEAGEEEIQQARTA